MTALSTRYLPALLVLVVLLFLPVAASRFQVRRVDDCARPDVLLDVTGLEGGARAVERWGRHDADVRQWTELDLPMADRDTKLRAAIIRSFRPSDLYTRPPHVLLGPFEAGQRRLTRVPVDDATLPIQSVEDATHGRNAVASWLFLFRGEPVRHPLLAQLATAPRQVWSGTLPLSLLVVAGVVPPDQEEQARRRAERWLVAAYRHHHEACTPDDGSGPASP